MSKKIYHRLFQPAIFYFMVVLISGTWLRAQWTWPEISILHAKFLIHAHSHLALLGWIFPVLAGSFIYYFVRDNFQKKLFSYGYWIPIHLCIILMTIAFTFQGYAFWSISLSTLYIIITSIWFIHFLINLDDQNTIRTLLLKLAVFSYLGSNIGPLALSGGTMYGESWITFWITYYLHTQFSLWIPLGVLAVLFSVVETESKHIITPEDSRRFSVQKLMIWGYFIGSILQLETMSRSLNSIPLSPNIGLLGSVLVLISSIYLVYILLVSIKTKVSFMVQETDSPRANIADQISSVQQNPLVRKIWHNSIMNTIVHIGLLLIILKAILQLVASIPEIGQEFTQTHYLKIGYTHLLLLGSYTFILIGISHFIKNKIFNLISVQQVVSRWNVIGYTLFTVGSLSMILLLLFIGLHQYLGIALHFNIQFYLFLSGLLSLSGFITAQR